MLKEEELTYKIPGCEFEVYRHLVGVAMAPITFLFPPCTAMIDMVSMVGGRDDY